MGDLPHGIRNSPIVGYSAVAALHQFEFHIITEGATGLLTAVLHGFSSTQSKRTALQLSCISPKPVHARFAIVSLL